MNQMMSLKIVLKMEEILLLCKYYKNKNKNNIYKFKILNNNNKNKIKKISIILII